MVASACSLIDPAVCSEFPALQKKHPETGKAFFYFDNACMTLRPRPVLDAWREYHETYPSCAGRASHYWADTVDREFVAAREAVRNLLGAGRPDQICFLRNTSEALNMVARGLSFHDDEIVITTGVEHNSNFVPWLLAVGEHRVLQVPSDPSRNTFDLDAFDHLLTLHGEKVRVIALGLTSNYTGYSIPFAEIAAIIDQHARRTNLSRTKVVLDAAQAIPYQRLNLSAYPFSRADFLAFSFHKMCAPTGGVLYMRDSKDPTLLKAWNCGGGTVLDISCGWPASRPAPDAFEAGLQDYAGIIGARAAIDFLLADGRLDRIKSHVGTLNRLVTQQLARFDGECISIVPPATATDRGSIFTFRTRADAAGAELDERLAAACNRENVMYRRGFFCAQLAIRREGPNRRWGKGHRFSFYIYNTPEECDHLVDVLAGVLKAA